MVILGTNCGHLFVFAVTGDPAAQVDLFTPGGDGIVQWRHFLLQDSDKHLFHFLLGTLNGKLF